MTAAGTALWAAVDRWVDAAPDPADLVEHRLQLVAARRMRATGRPVPEEFLELERHAAVVSLTAPMVLEQVRRAVEGPIILFKGMEVAARYPDPALRVFHDLDILVPDSAAAQGRLIDAGFEEVGEPEIYEDIHHLRPLRSPGLPIVVEVHHAPKWPDHASPPATERLMAASVAGTTGVDGVRALAPAAHALVLAAHSWSNVPLGRLRDLLDIRLVADEAAPGEVEALAREWGMERLWSTTHAASRAMFGMRRRPTFPLLTWARGARRTRSRTVLEYHLERWASSYWAVPPRRAMGQTAAAMGRELRPAPGEGWSRKLRRTARAARDAGRRKSEHDEHPPP